VRVTYLLRCLAMMRGGGETQHLAWIRGLRARGVDVTVITGRPLLGAPVYPEEPDLRTITLRSPYMRDFVYRMQHTRGFGRVTMWSLHADEEWFCRLAFKEIARQDPQPDLVLAHALYQAPRLASGAYPVAVYLPGEPHRRYLHDLRRADALIADGWAARELPAVIGRPVIDVPKGVDVDTYSPEGPDLRERLGLGRRPVILSVARLVPIKNLPMLLEAVALVRHERPDAVLLVVGDGPQKAALDARARELGLAETVRFVGYVAQAETPAWYRTADVFALSSDFDNSPNVVLEAMASGRPVVATDVGGLRDYVTPDTGGRLTAKGDARAFADAILAFLSDREGAVEAGRRSRDVVVARYSWAASAARMHDVYASAIDRWRARTGGARMAAAS
jgi:glycosyltransferase involved in cell wall biosynthesis